MRTIKLNRYKMLIAVIFTAFICSFLTSATRIVRSIDETVAVNDVLTIYYDTPSNIPFSSAGYENSLESNSFQVNTFVFKPFFLYRIQFHTQLFLSMYDNSNAFFFQGLARKKLEGYYLFNLCKLLI